MKRSRFGEVAFEAQDQCTAFGYDASGTGDTEARPCDEHAVDLAFLSPETVGDVLDGKQPIGFASVWDLRNQVPSDWCERRALLAQL